MHLKTTVGVATYTADIFSHSYLHEVCNIVFDFSTERSEWENALPHISQGSPALNACNQMPRLIRHL